MKKLSIILLLVSFVMGSSPVFGVEVTDAQLKTIKNQMRQMQAKIDALEAGSGTKAGVSQEQIDAMVDEAMSKEDAPEWLSKVFGFEGELTYTHEQFDDDKADVDDRQDTLKALITVYGSVNDETDLAMRLRADTVQGEQDDKNVDMEFMYVDYHPQSINKLPFIGTGIDMLSGVSPFYDPGVVEGTHVLLGRVPYAFYHPVNVNIAFDGPELDGFAAMFRSDSIDNVEMFATASGAWINNKDDGPDSSLWAGQVGFTYLIPGMEDTYCTMAAGYFDYGNVEGILDGSSNTVVNPGSDDLLVNDYDLMVINGEINFPITKDIPILCDYPITIFGEYAQNTAAVTSGDTAYAFGASLGEITEVGCWQLVYNYRDIEKDAALDMSNAGIGDTATDVTGHVFDLAYRLAENISLSTTFETGKQDVSGDEKDYEKWTLGVGFAF